MRLWINGITRQAALATALIGGLLGVSNASGQTTSFTYQGLLKNGGSTASGSFDMTFRVFDDPTAGNQVGADVPVKGVDVANGLFTAAIDFGTGVFSGLDLWLEIDVNSVTMSPRQAITSAPYSQSAENAQSCNVANYATSAGYAAAPWVASGSDIYFSDGNVGIGTATPTARLEVAGTPGVDGVKFPDGTVQVSAAVSDSKWSVNGSAIYNNNAGGVGIGTQTPIGSFEVHTPGHTLISGGALGVTGDSTPFPTAAGRGVFFTGGSTANVFGFDYTNYVPQSLILQSPGGNVGIGTTTPGAKLEVAGRTMTHSLQIIGGSDLAEPFDISGDDIRPGMVVVIDSAHPGRLKACSANYDRKVAGIISGAGGVCTGLSMTQQGSVADGKHAVALSGRVYCQVDATFGAIEPGDMLTTSARAGHAMKATDFDKARGAIIGKAMTSLKSGTGLVLVLVNLQ